MVAEAQHRSHSSRPQAVAADTGRSRARSNNRRCDAGSGCKDSRHINSRSGYEPFASRRSGELRFSEHRRSRKRITSFRQIEANRRNALSSTGPKTENGKRRSRHNAVRHGLTAETVVVALEDIEDYQAFEAAVIADYDARTAVERELVLRLASLRWRIRRATRIETDLLQIQAEILHERRCMIETASEGEQKLHGMVYRALR